MSHQHVSETYKKLARLQEDGKKRADQYEKALQRYRDTWSNHQKVYCSFPGVAQIMLLEDEVQTLQSKGLLPTYCLLWFKFNRLTNFKSQTPKII